MSVDPARLSILYYPHPSLRRRAEPVAEITEEVRSVAMRMIELMHAAPGIGLAAPQVGLPWRLFVADVPAREDDPAGELPDTSDGAVVYINPELSEPEGTPELHEEGCLSLPEIYGQVLRHPTITISATDLHGCRFSRRGTGLLARCWQHEADHLDGRLIIDRMRRIDRIKARSAIRQLERSL